ncbi:MAG: hypothetical protein ACI9US_002626, partial [Gammaproteobacteria bacterium]
PNVEVKAEPEAKAAPKVEVKAEPEAKAAPKVEVKAEPEAKAAPKVKAEPEAKAAAAPKIESEPKGASPAESKPVVEETKVSQRQPSQLKSTVRSLANKDDQPRGTSSFASKKVADVTAPVKAADSRETVASTAEKVGD